MDFLEADGGDGEGGLVEGVEGGEVFDEAVAEDAQAQREEESAQGPEEAVPGGSAGDEGDEESDPTPDGREAPLEE